MLDHLLIDVATAAELDREIRNILALDMVQRGDEISGTLNVHYTDDSVQRATLIPVLVARGVTIAWHKKAVAPGAPVDPPKDAKR